MKVEIVGKHPHAGKCGECDMKSIWTEERLGWRMLKVDFEDGSGCFADRKNVKLIGKNEDR